MTLRTWRIAVAATAAATLVLVVAAACSGDDAQPASNTSPPASKSPVATAHTAHAAEIDQQGLVFIPERVTVKVGETVLIKNSETAIHTGNINGKNITGNMKRGDSTPWTATQAGEFKVTCDYHPAMKSTIVVTP